METYPQYTFDNDQPIGIKAIRALGYGGIGAAAGMSPMVSDKIKTDVKKMIEEMRTPEPVKKDIANWGLGETPKKINLKGVLRGIKNNKVTAAIAALPIAGAIAGMSH